MSATQSIIQSRFNNRVIECPMSLLTQLRRERQSYCQQYESISGDSDALLSEAERIKKDTALWDK